MDAGRRENAIAAIRPRVVQLSSVVLAFLLGAVTVAGFAPFYLFPVPIFTLAVLFQLWSAAQTARAAATIGFAFGCGLFLCGVSWVYVSLHDFGAMPVPLAAAVTLLFCAFLALFPASVAYACARSRMPVHLCYGLLAPAVWMLAEWTRGWIFTGFPWLALGYSQVPSSPLAGYAPALGIHGVTLATAATAGLLVVIWQRATAREPGQGPGAVRRHTLRSLVLHASVLMLAAIWLGGFALGRTEWTEAVGKPIKVSLLQGNVPQDMKWREDRVLANLETYRALTRLSPAALIVTPETALPLFLGQVPHNYLEELAAHARKNGGDILIGVPEREPGGHYFNSVISFGSSDSQTYRKSHLVPFGEFIPLRPVLGWLVGVLAIPLQDFSRGADNPRPLAVAGQKVAVNICYEDAFGEEIIRQLPEATLLINASNVAWFGRSIAPYQHLQISQARALETGRVMLRATNTGITAVIGIDGRVIASAPGFTMTTVTHVVRGHAGATPYVRWGNYAALALGLLLLVIAFGIKHRAARSAA